MISNKMISDDLKTIKELVIKGFAKADSKFDIIDGRLDGIDGRLNSMDIRFDSIDGRLEKLDKKIDEVKIELKSDIEDLAGMTAREFAAMRGEFSLADK